MIDERALMAPHQDFEGESITSQAAFDEFLVALAGPTVRGAREGPGRLPLRVHDALDSATRAPSRPLGDVPAVYASGLARFHVTSMLSSAIDGADVDTGGSRRDRIPPHPGQSGPATAFPPVRPATSMGAPQSSESTRRRLLALMADGATGADQLLAELQSLRRREGVPACSSALRLLVALDLNEPEAERLLGALLRHRDQLRAALGRDPGLSVAAMDLFANITPRLAQPAIIEQAASAGLPRLDRCDPITRLPNRREGLRVLERELRRTRRYGRGLSLLSLDIDGLRRVNSRLGHAQGDTVIRRIAEILRVAVRDTDTLFRAGGDEFALVLPGTDRHAAYTVAERLRHEVGRRFDISFPAGSVAAPRLSGGVATAPDDAAEAGELLDRTAAALRLAKAAGGHRTVAFHAEKRRHPRFPVRSGVRAQLAVAGSAGALQAAPVDLSTHGASVRVVGEVPAAGSMVELLWARSHPSFDDDRLVREARVVRVAHEPGRATGRLIALAFESPIPYRAVERRTLGARPPSEASL